MDSEALKTFVAIHRAGGFSQAAEQLLRSQPAISRRIAVLEDESVRRCSIASLAGLC